LLAYCLQVRLKHRLRAPAPGAHPAPGPGERCRYTAGGCALAYHRRPFLVLPRYRLPDPEQTLWLKHLKLQLPDQPSPRIAAPLACAS
jgi:hypothetical protein